MKSLFASKTFWFNVLSAVVTIAGIIPANPVTTGIIAVGNVVLRLVTNQPVSVTGSKLS